MKYFPNKPFSAGRVFVFSIVNTLDPVYFARALGEVERLKLADKMKEKQPAEVDICPEMQDILAKHAGLSSDKKQSS